MITYRPAGKRVFQLDVYLDNKLIGHIREFEDGMRYTAKGGKFHGEKFANVDLVKASLEEK